MMPGGIPWRACGEKFYQSPMGMVGTISGQECPPSIYRVGKASEDCAGGFAGRARGVEFESLAGIEGEGGKNGGLARDFVGGKLSFAGEQRLGRGFEDGN